MEIAKYQTSEGPIPCRRREARMTTTEDASAMTEASRLTNDEGRIEQAAEAIRGMTKEMVKELPARRAGLAKTLRDMTLEAPLQSLAIAFLLGVLIARRR